MSVESSQYMLHSEVEIFYSLVLDIFPELPLFIYLDDNEFSQQVLTTNASAVLVGLNSSVAQPKPSQSVAQPVA